MVLEGLTPLVIPLELRRTTTVLEALRGLRRTLMVVEVVVPMEELRRTVEAVVVAVAVVEVVVVPTEEVRRTVVAVGVAHIHHLLLLLDNPSPFSS